MRIRSNEAIERNYNVESLEYMIESAKDMQDRLDKHITKVEAQIKKVHDSTFAKIVILRRDEHSKPTLYNVSLHTIPNIKGGKNTYYPTSYHEQFVGGRKKKEAVEYAESLAKEQGAELRKEGFK